MLFNIKWNECSWFRSDRYDPASLFIFNPPSSLGLFHFSPFLLFIIYLFLSELQFVTVQNGGTMNYEQTQTNANRKWWHLHLRSEQLQQFSLNVCLVSWINSAALITVNHSSLIFIKTLASLRSIFRHFWIQTYQFSCHPYYRGVNFPVWLLNVAPYFLPCSFFCRRNIFFFSFIAIFVSSNQRLEKKRVPVCSLKGSFSTSEGPALTAHN